MADFDDVHEMGEDANHNGDELIFSLIPRDCANCGKKTHWLSNELFAYLCSEECYAAFQKSKNTQTYPYNRRFTT